MNPTNTITVAQIPSILALHSAPGCKPALFISLPGVGKTSSLHKFSADHNYDLFQLMLPHYSVPDLKGFGIPNRDKGVMEFLPSGELPWCKDGKPYAETHGGRRPLVFLDEVLGTTGALFNVAQQLIHEKRIGDNILPPDVLIAAAGNDHSMKCGSSKLTMSLADRFAIYHVRPDFDAVSAWMSNEKNGINQWIYAFLQAMHSTGGGVLWSLTTDKWNGGEPIDSARSYAALSKVFAQFDDEFALMNSPVLGAICTGHIGQASGLKLAEFIKLSIQVGNIEEMVANPDTCALPTTPDLCWGVAARTVTMATKDNLDNIFTLVRRLTPKSMRPKGDAPTVFEAFVARAVMKVRPESIIGSPTWLNWAKKNRKYINPGAAV